MLIELNLHGSKFHSWVYFISVFLYYDISITDGSHTLMYVDEIANSGFYDNVSCASRGGQNFWIIERVLLHWILIYLCCRQG